MHKKQRPKSARVTFRSKKNSSFQRAHLWNWNIEDISLATEEENELFNQTRVSRPPPLSARRPNTASTPRSVKLKARKRPGTAAATKSVKFSTPSSEKRTAPGNQSSDNSTAVKNTKPKKLQGKKDRIDQLLRLKSCGSSSSSVTKEEVTSKEEFFRLCRSSSSTLLARSNPAPRQYIKTCESLGLAPESMDLSGNIQLENKSLGDLQFQAVLAQLQNENSAGGITVANLKGNRLSHRSIKLLVQPMQKVWTALTTLNLSYNKIGKTGLDALANGLLSTLTLKHINLSHNHINDQQAFGFFRALASCSIKSLDVSRNNISDRGANILSDTISRSKTLTRLNCAWNTIQGAGCIAFSNALRENNVLETLDLSWNPLGNSSSSSTQALANAIAHNSHLLHLILQHNNFSTSDCEILASGFCQNFTVILHFVGDFGYVDTKQNFLPRTSSSPPISSALTPSPLVDEYYCPNCWICNNWVEHRFVVSSSDELTEETTELYLHLEIDGYIGDSMYFVKEENDTTWFYLNRMVPPGRNRYYYSFQEQVNTDGVDISNRDCISYNEVYATSSNTATANDDLPVLVCNYSFPRHKKWGRTVGDTSSTEWKVENSVFAARLSDPPFVSFFDEPSIDAAFENDWKHSKINRLVRDEDLLSGLRVAIQAHYKTLYYIFRHYCCSTGEAYGDCFSISLLEFGEFCADCQIPDLKNCRISDIDRVFIAVNVELEDDDSNSDTNCERFEFIEAVARLAIMKYFSYRKSRDSNTPASAFEKLLRQNVIPNAMSISGDVFRRQHLYTEETERALLPFIPSIKVMYRHYGHSRRVSGKALVCLSGEDLAEILTDANILGSDGFGRKEFNQTYAACKTIYVDELGSPHRVWLTFFDFLEFLVRLWYYYNKENSLESLVLRLVSNVIKVKRQLRIKLQPNLKDLIATKHVKSLSKESTKLSQTKQVWRRRSTLVS